MVRLYCQNSTCQIESQDSKMSAIAPIQLTNPVELAPPPRENATRFRKGLLTELEPYGVRFGMLIDSRFDMLKFWQYKRAEKMHSLARLVIKRKLRLQTLFWKRCWYTFLSEHFVQSTHDNSNLEGESKKVRVIGSSSYREFEANNRK